MEINILILSVGTRNKIVQYLKKALTDQEGNRLGSVIATDMSNIAPAIYEADKYYQVPRMCDEVTARLINREVSDGVIAPDYTPEALEILKNKRKGTYNVIKIDPSYRPAPIEHKDVFGITFEQGRNEIKLDESLLTNIPTKNQHFTEEANAT